MGTVVGLLLGAGMFAIWWSCWEPTEKHRRRPARWSAGIQDLLVQAGSPAVTPTALAASSAGIGAVVFGVVALLSRPPAIAIFFASASAADPSKRERFRARRRLAN